jgi:hypothetical protein
VYGESPAKSATYDLSMWVSYLMLKTVEDCFLFTLSLFSLCVSDNADYSQNVTVENSPGFVRPNDPAYANLPPDSRKPPAPIDPSSKLLFSE